MGEGLSRSEWARGALTFEDAFVLMEAGERRRAAAASTPGAQERTG
jgi:hypothetical protein